MIELCWGWGGVRAGGWHTPFWFRLWLWISSCSWEMTITLSLHVCTGYGHPYDLGLNHKFWMGDNHDTDSLCGYRMWTEWGWTDILGGSGTHHVDTGYGYYHVLGVELHVLKGDYHYADSSRSYRLWPSSCACSWTACSGGRLSLSWLTMSVQVVDIMYFGMNYRSWREIIIILTHKVCTGCQHNALWDELQVLEENYHYPDSLCLYRS